MKRQAPADRATKSQPDSSSSSTLRLARKVVIAMIGTTVLAIGVALIVLPGPAVLVIPLGLAILATEFFWARRMLNRVRRGVTRLGRWIRPTLQGDPL
jgi:uncharacterized protein (TIGR02611 family)